MNVIEFIGFIVSFFVFVCLMFRRTREGLRPSAYPGFEEQTPPVKTMRAIKPVVQAKRLASRVADAHYDSPSNHIDPYSLEKKQIRSRGQDLLTQLPSKKQMILYYEIFSRPKGWRK
jgi:hypothetical protein